MIRIRFTLWWRSLLILPALVPLIGAGPSKDSLARARTVAIEHLAREYATAQHDTTWWGRHWGLNASMDFSQLSIGDPFESYLMKDDGLSIIASTGNLLAASDFGLLDFPVYHHDVLIGSIGISQHDGEWTFGGQGGPTRLFDFALELRKSFAKQPLVRVVIVRCYTLGIYLLAVDGERPLAVMPLNDGLLARLGRSLPAVFDYDEVVEPLRNYARDMHDKQQMEMKQREKKGGE